MARTEAYVTPEVLRWAREAVARELDAAAAKIDVSEDRLERAERGAHLLTIRQAELAAEAYGQPLAALFMPEPPDVPSIERRFRMLRGAPRGPWSHELVSSSSAKSAIARKP